MLLSSQVNSAALSTAQSVALGSNVEKGKYKVDAVYFHFRLLLVVHTGDGNPASLDSVYKHNLLTLIRYSETRKILFYAAATDIFFCML